MTGRHKFSDLEAGLPPERLSRIGRLADALSAKIDHAEASTEQSRVQVLQLLEQFPEGLTRREILEKLGQNGNEADKTLIDQILTGLRDSRVLRLKARKYQAA